MSIDGQKQHFFCIDRTRLRITDAVYHLGCAVIGHTEEHSFNSGRTFCHYLQLCRVLGGVDCK